MFNLLATIPRVCSLDFNLAANPRWRIWRSGTNSSRGSAPPKAQPHGGRPVSAGTAAALLVRVAADAAHRSAAHRRGLASGRIPWLLALEIALEYRKAAVAS
jgi:hypothetical protein